MKRKFKLLLIFILATSLLSGCKKVDTSNKVAEEESKPKTTSIADDKNLESKEKTSEKEKPVPEEKIDQEKKIEKLAYVNGGNTGSMSSYVEDRELWKDFTDEKHIAAAKKISYGLHLPRILLDSEDAKEANKDLDDLAKNILGLYESYRDQFQSEELGVFASFSAYQDENILSLMVETFDWQEAYPLYRIYNFSLPDGRLIKDQELMKNFGLDEDDLLRTIESSLKDYQDLTRKIYYSDDFEYFYESNPSNYTGKILDDLWDQRSTKENQIYIDQVARPNFIFASYPSLESGFGPQILELKRNTFDTSPLSDEYIKMARKLGIDPNDNKYKAFIIFLGASYDEDSLKASLEKLQPLINAFNNYEDPNLLATIKENKEGQRPYLIGQECYLLIPKYKNASVSLKELELAEDGNLKEVDNNYLDYTSCAGTTLICQNISDIVPNAKITLRYRDDILEFSPSISLKDGSLILPDEVFDAEDIYDFENPIKEDSYSLDLFKKFKFLLGQG